MTRDGAARLARQAHNLKVVGSNPTPATIFCYNSTVLCRGMEQPG